MSHNSTHATIHLRFKNFVKWIAPEEEKREKIVSKSDEIMEKISKKATDDDLIVISRNRSGSFSKESGLRRFMRGNSAIEGQDIDLSFILDEYDKNGVKQGCLVEKFKGYAKDCYPDNEVGNTKSSATIIFSATKLQYDLVPLFKVNGKELQILKRTDLTERKTSVKKHTEFSLKRKEESDSILGVVKFNECVRLIKWWKYEQQEKSNIFGNEEGDEKIPSFLLDLLCAFAYDTTSVDKTYSGTLAKWFGFLANVVRNRKDVKFKNETFSNTSLWNVIDPVDSDNNLVKNWSNIKLNELARWLEDSRDEMNRAIRFDEQGEDKSSLDCLVKIFGNSFKNHCE